MRRYSILSVMACTTIAALCITSISNYKLSAKVVRQSDEIGTLEKHRKALLRISQILSSLDRDESHESRIHKEAARITRGLLQWTSDRALRDNDLKCFGSESLLRDVDGKLGGLEMLVLHQGGRSIPGSVRTIIALFDDNDLVDIVCRSDSLRRESHTVSLTDADDDGELDAIIDVRPGFFRDGPSTEVIVYNATADGLRVAIPITGG